MDAFFGYRHCMINPCFFPCDTALQKLLCLIGTMCKMYESKCHTTSFVIVSEAPNMHTFFCNPVGYGQCQLKMPFFSNKGICMKHTLLSVVDVLSLPCCCLSSSVLPLPIPLYHIRILLCHYTRCNFQWCDNLHTQKT